MKVLFITHATDLSGANRSMLQMIKELQDNYNIEPFIVFPKIFDKSENNIEKKCLEWKIPYIEHRMTNFKRHKNISIFEIFYFIIMQTFCVSHLLWILRNRKFDLIHSNSSVNDTGAYISYFKKTPHVWHLREFGGQDFNKYSCLGLKYENWIYKKCNKFIAISESVKERFKDVIDENRIIMIYNGVVPLDDSYLSKHDSENVNFCIVGRVEKNKNQLEAIHAIRVLRAKSIDGFKLYIIGKADPVYEQSLIDFIKQNNLENYCTLMGVRYDVPDLLKKMDVGLMLSTCEAFGRVTVEYMMQNLAVIVSNTGANPEIVKDKEDGLLYELGRPDMLANCMIHFIKDKRDLINLAYNGHNKAMKLFSSTQNSDSVYNLYQSIVK